MRLAKFVKTPNENKRYVVDYTNWLDTGETISSGVLSVSPATSPALTAGTLTINAGGKSVNFFIAAGKDGSDYTVTLQVTTSIGQIKEDTILYSARA